MKVCILGDGLTSLTLAKILVEQRINVDIFSSERIKKFSKNQTLGISNSNIDFFNKNILNIEKLLWNINNIEIYSEKLNNEKILNFQDQNQRLFSIIKNFELYNLLLKKLRNIKICNFYKEINIKELLKKNYKLIINCDYYNPVTKKFFFKQIRKDYKSFAYTSIINHKKIDNNVATQIFTSKGPLAFLPISKEETSIVYSVNGNLENNFKGLVEKYNTKYNILSFKNISKFELKSLNLRSYYHKNILAFGDLLHRVHPLAGQGFNMILRDIKEIFNLIIQRKHNGLDLDYSICIDFEKKMRHKNYLFSNGIDFIYEFFNFENKIDNNILSKTVKYLGKKNTLNKIFTKIADDGFVT